MNHDRSYRRHWFYSIDHSRGRRGIRYSFGCFSRIKKMLGRIETRTRDRIYCQTIRTVRDISRDDRARIATCNLRMPTYRLKENYSIDLLFLTPRLHHYYILSTVRLNYSTQDFVKRPVHPSFGRLYICLDWFSLTTKNSMGLTLPIICKRHRYSHTFGKIF